MDTAVKDIYLQLCSTELVCTVGFALGFLYDFKFNKETLLNPLSTIFNSTLSGVVTLWGASILCGIFPPPLLCATTILGTTSCVYYVIRNIG